MALATTCPSCATHFLVAPEQLKVRSGLVRCGVCQTVFCALDFLGHADDELLPKTKAPAATAHPPSQDPAPDATSDTSKRASPSDKTPAAGEPAFEHSPHFALEPDAEPEAKPAVKPEDEPEVEPEAKPEAGPAALRKAQAAPEPKPIASPLTADKPALPAVPDAAAHASETSTAAADFVISGPPTQAGAGLASRRPADTAGAHAAGRPVQAPISALALAQPEAGLTDAGRPGSRSGAARTPRLVEVSPAVNPAAHADPLLEEEMGDLTLEEIPQSLTWRSPVAPEVEDIDTITFLGLDEREQAAPSGLLVAGTVLAAVLTVSLLLQLAVGSRGLVASAFPSLARSWALAVEPLARWVPAPRDLRSLTIESFELSSSNRQGVLAVSATLHNQADYAVRWPAMELSLTDSEGALLARKVLLPGDYLAPGEGSPALTSGIGAQSDQAVRLALKGLQSNAAGYRVTLFYP
jgi:predicted Zn finger-like uncharacterized protein